MTAKESPFACDMSAIASVQRTAHLANIDRLFRAVESLHELPNGYSFRLRNEAPMLMTLAEFITLERLCCPFFGFGLELEPEGGSVSLSLTGRNGVKLFIMAEIGDNLPANVQH